MKKEVNVMGKLIAKNPTAKHNYTIVDTLESGIVLTGTEIKSIRAGKVNLKDSYASINKNGEVYIYSMHISPYEHGNIFNKDPLRARKLLLNRREINKIIGLINQKGYTLVPVSLYFKGSLVKLELGIGKGKKLYDKRQDIAKKDAEMKIRRAMKENYK
ncbi:MAG TPA: SsrA-binding protein SmpB [Clostridiaceae bacterium]|jgi:SsrA-binding protein|nr:SsrA-binding protein SmpB [Clostridiaceae bacterium]HJJ14764.1 SsrA-binding protein SmpB [Clostridiaceae bacterium]